VRGKLVAPVPPDLGAPGGGRAPAESLFDMEADEADLSRLDDVATVDARGHVRIHDDTLDARADRAVYRQESATVELEGTPVHITRGDRKEAGSNFVTIRLAPRPEKKE
jgi:hypothetical protein